VTEAERWLLRLIADAMMHPEAQHAPAWQHAIRKAYAAIDEEAFAREWGGKHPDPDA
jgi:hypothetical protein